MEVVRSASALPDTIRLPGATAAAARGGPGRVFSGDEGRTPALLGEDGWLMLGDPGRLHSRDGGRLPASEPAQANSMLTMRLPEEEEKKDVWTSDLPLPTLPNLLFFQYFLSFRFRIPPIYSNCTSWLCGSRQQNDNKQSMWAARKILSL